MYNNKLVCTYNFYDNSLLELNPFSKKYIEVNNNKSDIENDNIEMNFFADYLYKIELLEAFQLSNFDETIINQKMVELYNLLNVEMIENNIKNEFKEILMQLCEEDCIIAFMKLFSYHYFHITHLCICDFFMNKTFTEENIEYLKKCLYI